MLVSSRLFVAVGLLAGVSGARAQFSWQSAVSGLWSTPGNWTGGSIPTTASAASDVYIDFAPFALTGGVGNFTTTLDYNVNIRNLFTRANLVFSGGTLGLGQTGSQIDGLLTFNSGTINGGGILFAGGVNFPGVVDRSLTTTQATFQGVSTYGGGNLHTVNSTVSFAGQFLVGDGRIRDGVHTVPLGGVFRKTVGTGDFLISEGWNGGPRSVSIHGTLEAQEGRIIPMAGGTHSGLFWGNGGTIFLSNSQHNLLAGAKFRDGVVIAGAGVTIVGATDTLELIGAPQFQLGSLSGAGRLVGAGSLELTTAGNKSIGGTLRSEVDINLHDGFVYAVNSTFTNAGTLAIQGARRWHDGRFFNEGVIDKFGAGQAIMGQGWNGGPTSFDNSGTIESFEGSLAIVTGGAHSGAFIGSGGTIDFNAAAHRFDPGHALHSGVNFNAGTFQIPEDTMLNCVGAVKFNGGTLTRTGTNPALIGGTGSLDIENAVSLASVLRLVGRLNWNAGIVSAVNSTFTNEGEVTINSDSDWRDGILENVGTLTKTSSGTTRLSQSWSGGTRQVNNSGTITALSGTLEIKAPGTHSGLFHGNGGTITFPDNAHTFNSGSILRGATLLNGTTASVGAGQTLTLEGTTWSAGTLGGTGQITGPEFFWTGTANLAGSLTSSANIQADTILRQTVNSTFTNNFLLQFEGNCTWRDGILINNGNIEASGGTTQLNIAWSGGTRDLRNNGSITADAGTITIHGNGTHFGTFSGLNGGAIQFVDGTHTMRSGSKLGTGTSTSTSIVDNETVSIVGESEWRSSSWTGTGVIQGDLWRWTTGSTKSLGGHLKCEADISHEAGVVAAANTTFTNRGIATIGDGLSWRDGIWNNEGTIRKIAGAGTSVICETSSGGTRQVTNSGTLSCSSGTLRVGNTLTNYAPTPDQMNGGTYEARAGGNLHLPIGPVVINAGRFVLDGPTSIVSQSNGSTSALATLATNLGGLEVSGGHNLLLPGPLMNSGDILVGQGSSLDPNGNFTQTAGSARVNGILAAPIDIQGGVLGGTGTTGAGVVNSSTVAPGNSTGTLTIDGNLSLNTSTLDIEVASSAPGFFDQLAVVGTVTIGGGTLAADAAPNSTVTSGTTVDVVTASSRSGNFTTHPNPLDWQVSYGATFVRLTALRTIIGPILVEGQVDLDGWNAAYTSVPLTFELRQSGAVVESNIVNPNIDGSYAMETRRRGSFQLFVYGPHWLVKQYPGNIVLTDAGLQGIDFDLVNGDVDQDNEITIGDYAILSTAFGSVPGDPNWEPNADLDGDEEIAIGDYAILSSNFGLAGD